MGKLHRARVTAVGSQEDMLRMARAMLDNGDWLHEEEEYAPPETLERRLEQLARHARWEGGEFCGFLAEMISPNPYGELIPETCRLQVAEHPCGLWTALFTMDSEDAFQPEDWVKLHERSGRMPFFAMHAGEDFAMEKGGVIFTGGAYYEDWNLMGEIWLWLQKQYYAGRSPEEIPQALQRLDAVLAREWDQDARTLLQGCLAHLERVQSAARAVTADALTQAREAKDFHGLFSLQAALAAGTLWDIDRVARWRACLENDLTAYA